MRGRRRWRRGRPSGRMPATPGDGMTAAAQNLLTAFDALPDAERDAFIAAALVRRPVCAGDLPDVAFEELAEEIFLSCDAAEAADAPPR